MPTEKVNGVNIYYELTGAKGDPLVLVHGSWGNHHNWDMITGEFAKTFRVLTYDRRGHSQSERVSGQGWVAEDIDDLVALVEQLKISPAHIVGNSFGASIILKAAAEFMEKIAMGPGAWEQLPDSAKNIFIYNAITWYDEVQDPQSLQIDLSALSVFKKPALLSVGSESPPFFPWSLTK